MRREPVTNSNEEGVALVLALCLMLVASVIGASMMILSQTETYSSINYRSMTQARYSAESGVHKAINHILNNYAQPGSGTDPLSNYNMNVSPVTYNGQPVVLSGTTGVASNYPDATKRTAFNTAAQGSLAIGGATLQYSAYATLISMKTIAGYGTGTSTVLQTWQITGTGTTGGNRPATVEVSATLEQQSVSFNMYGLFATSATCGALAFSGGVVTNSYDSSSMTLSGGVPVTQNTNGDVGTNGNLTESGGATVNGTLSTPRTGIGNCSSGNVDALTASGGATVTGGVIQLPQSVSFATPALPSPLPPTANQVITSTTSCASAGFTGVCSGPSGAFTLTPGAGGVISAGNVKLSGGAVMHLNAGTYNLNSISLSGNAQVIIDTGPVIMNIVGTGQTNPVGLSGGAVTNGTFLPKNLQIIYAGTNGVQLSGGTSTSFMVYAPNAQISLSGGSGIYGSILGRTIQDSGGVAIHYDRDLPTEFATSWNTMLTSFSWKKY